MINKLQTRSSRIFFITVTLVCIGALVILSFFVNKDAFRSIDYNLMIGLQSSIDRSVDIPFSVVTILGSTEATLVFLGSIFIIILLKKKHLFISLVLFFAIYAIELVGKLFIYHPLPPPTLNRYALPLRLPSSFIVHTNFSYPSGHMARTTFLIVILLALIYIYREKKKSSIWAVLFLAVYFIVMFISRIYLGEHWLSDVLGGVLLGAGVSTIALALW